MIDFTKPVFTKSGHKVTILTISLKAHQPVVGIYHGEDGEEVEQWSLHGKFFVDAEEAGLDLTNEPPKTLVD